MHQQLRDEELIRMYLDTRRNDYFETLYKRYVSKVYRRCLSLTKDSDKAEDFTHDIFLRVYSNLNHFKERSAFSTWLYSISYNYCMDQLRVAHRSATVPLEEGTAYEAVDVDESEPVEYQLQYLSRALNAISTEEVMLLRLKYEEGLDIKDIAQRFNLKDSAVKMRLKRTRDKIRRLYAESSF